MEMSRRFITESLGKAVLLVVCVLVCGFIIALLCLMPGANVWLAGVAAIVSVISLVSSGYMFVRSHIVSMKPVLVFTQDTADDGNERWFLCNVGNGPALNVVVAKRDDGGEWKEYTMVPTLARDTNSKIELGGFEIQCVYFDIDQRRYLSRCKDWTTTFPENEPFPLPERSTMNRSSGLPRKV